tara:strand:+ start:1471 stop:1881 length:411 start_codon:yes stop_codon:yes gene_type:complete
MNNLNIFEISEKMTNHTLLVASNVENLAFQAGTAGVHSNHAVASEFWYLLTIFVLAIFIGFYVVWSVTPALHSPLMAVTNAVSSVIIVGALIATGLDGVSTSKLLGFCGIILASVNIFGGFIVTQRMLAMYKKKGK